MADSERGRSPDLEQVRHLLFPDLPPEEGWARIDRAIRGASDDERWAAIEQLAGEDLSDDLLTRLVSRRHAQKTTIARTRLALLLDMIERELPALESLDHPALGGTLEALTELRTAALSALETLTVPPRAE